MDKEMLFFDIDGTLVSNMSPQIPGSALQAIEKARQNGHYTFINTGRTRCFARQFIRPELPFDGYLCACGCTIIFHGKTLLQRSYTPEEGKRLTALMKQYRIEAFLEGSEDIYCTRASYRQEHLNKAKHMFARLGFCQNRFMEDMDFSFDKFIFFSDGQDDVRGFMKALADEITFIDRGRGMYECIPKGFSKVSGMQYMSDYLGIPLSRSAAFGDSSNDCQMLAAAGRGIAMGRHDKVLEQYAAYITDTVENDGIAKALRYAGFI